MKRTPVALLVVFGILFPLYTTLHAPPALAQEEDVSAEEQREQKIVERFVSLLEKNPRRGTALDRAYGYHVERGTLEQWVKSYRDRLAKSPDDGQTWMVLGLIEAQRGKDADAVAALREAEKRLPESAMASYYLGQSLVLVGQPDQAAEAFERAIARKPERPDLLEIFQSLGRVHQRAHRNAEALAVWARLEKLFPDDSRVLEQIGATLAEERQFAEALKRFERLAAKTTDRYRQVTYGMEIAELKVRLGRMPEALADFEKQLGQLNPDSWLYREVRRKTEEVFRRNDDLAGLTKYYEGWLEKHPDDIDAITRLGRVLTLQGRDPEARAWLEKAIVRAPTDRALRSALIESLVADEKFSEAIAQFEEMDKSDPNNPDAIRAWGRLQLKDTSKPAEERKRLAVETWRRLLAAHPKDAVVAAQVADLVRQAEAPEEAIALYRQAIELAPDAPQYREYLGEYLHTLKRSKEALEVWRQIAEGKNRNPKNLARLAEVYAGFGYRDEAIAAIAEACKLEPDDFANVVRHAELLAKGEQFEAALAQLDIAAKLAEDPEERQTVLQQQIANFQAAGKLTEQIAALRQELDTGKDATPDRWRRLALFYEADRQLPEAIDAVRKAIALDEKDITSWATAARVYESAGDFQAAADSNRKLAATDRRFRTEYLTRVASLEQRLGRRAEALKAGRELLAAAPGNADHYKFHADLCFQLGEMDEGFDTLRRAVRANPSDSQALLTLAEALANQFQTDEAAELYWRAFDKADSLDAKLGVITQLTELSLRNNRLDQLLDRIKRQGNEADNQRETGILLAQAYHAAGDYGSARQHLETLLSENQRDTQLLQQLFTLAETEGDLESAVSFQKRLAEVAPSKEADFRLSQLLVRMGEIDEAQAIWSKMADSQQERHRILEAVDSLLANNKYDAALTATNRLLRENPRDWEGLYREGMALAGLDRNDQATQRFEAILELPNSLDEQSAIVKARMSQTKGKPAAASRFSIYQQSPAQQRLYSAYQIASVVGLTPSQNYYGGGMQARVWSPTDYGQARIAAIGWQLAQATKAGKADAFLAQRRGELAKNPKDRVAARDFYFLQLMRREGREIYAAAKQLSEGFDPEGCAYYLASLPSRTVSQNATPYVRSRSTKDTTPPLPEVEVNHIVRCLETIRKQSPDLMDQTVLSAVFTELRRAKRDDEGKRLLKELSDAANDPAKMLSIFSLAVTEGDSQTVFAMMDKLDRQPGSQAQAMAASYYGSYLGNLMGKKADDKSLADVVAIFDRFALSQRRAKENAHQRRRASSAYSNTSNYYSIYMTGGQSRGIQIAFPKPSEYFDHGSIQLLRNAFEIYKREDVLSDLFAHFDKQAMAGAGADSSFARLALCYLRWWNDEKDLSVLELARALKAAPAEIEMRMQLAELKAQVGEVNEAIELLDEVDPTDQAVMQQREKLALRLSVLAGNIDRARVAAERLFGLRLDTNSQAELAGQMSQLGMHELAEAVLARTQRRAGNQMSVLVSLMQQYQRQGKDDIAVQIAHQILRRTSPSRTAQPYYYYNESENTRQQAMQTLARSNKLGELIARVESQLERTPTSTRLRLTLADYYRAANQRPKVLELYAKMVETQPKDAQLRFQYAKELLGNRDAKGAAAQFALAVNADPKLLERNYSEIQQAFTQANQREELARMIESLDFKSFGNYYVVGNLVQNLGRDPKSREVAVRLIRKASEAFPNQRLELLRYLYDAEIWKNPEMYEMGLGALLPTTDQAQADPWYGTRDIMSWSSNGQVTSLYTQLVECARANGKTDQLAREIEQKVKEIPAWKGGKAFLAISKAQSGQIDEAKKLFSEAFDETDDNLSYYTCMIIGQYLDSFVPLQPMVIKLYEKVSKRAGSVSDSDSDGIFARRLAKLLQKAGRSADARDYLLQAAKTGSAYDYEPGYGSYQRIQKAISISAELLTLNCPVDALYLLDQVSDPSVLSEAQQYGGDYLARQIQESTSKALTKLNAETLAHSLRSFAKQPVKSEQAKSSSKEGSATAEAQPDAPAVDLLLLVSPRDLDRANVLSLFQLALEAAVSDKKLLEGVSANVSKLREQHPKDFSVAVADTLLAFAQKNPEQIDAAMGRLMTLVDETPLEKLGPGVRPNARHRAEAVRQIPLWLVAAEAAKNDKTKQAAEQLSQRAIEAAERQMNPMWLMAMLREQGQRELDRGDKAAAEKAWTQLLDRLIARPEVKQKPQASAAPQPGRIIPPGATPTQRAPSKGIPKKKAPSSALEKPTKVGQAPGAGANQFQLVAAQIPVPAVRVTTTTASPVAAATQQAGLVSTLEKFQQLSQFAKLAAGNGMTDLSLRAVREALAGGAPVQPLKASSVRSGMGQSSALDEQANMQVEAKIFELDRLWREKQAEPQKVYQTLAEVVLPKSRPGEIFLYPRQTNQGSIQKPRSVGRLLVVWAVAAKQTEDLKQRIVDRQKQPMATLPAAVLLSQLGQASGSAQMTIEQLQSIQKRLATDTLQYSAELALHAAFPAAKDPATFDSAWSVLDVASKNVAKSGPNAQDLASRISMGLAKIAAEHGDAAKAKEQLDAHLELSAQMNARYGGDHGSYRRRQQLIETTGVLAVLGQTTEALDYLGEYADLPTIGNWRTNAGGTASRLEELLAGMPAAKRYAVLKTWTMPTKSRRSVRLLIESRAAIDEPPAPFQKNAKPPKATKAEAAGDQPSTSQPPGIVCLVNLLIDAAKESGNLDGLADETRPLAKEKVENAPWLHCLVELARGRGESVQAEIKELFDTQKRERPKAGENTTALDWQCYVLGHACLADPAVRDLGLSRLEEILATAPLSSADLNDALRRAVTLGRLRSAGFEDAAESYARPALWHSIWPQTAAPKADGVASAWWVQSEGHLSRIGGPQDQYYFFKYPLVGQFEFSVETYLGRGVQGGVLYGGLSYTLGAPPNQSVLRNVNRYGQMTRTVGRSRYEGFNRPSVLVENGKAIWRSNDHLFLAPRHPCSGSPWLALVGMSGQQAVFRNLRLTGTPQIPREVSLISNDRLEGWTSNNYAALPTLLSDPAKPASPKLAAIVTAQQSYAWGFKDGVLSAWLNGARGMVDAPEQSISYFRPLQDEEQVRYEFQYKPGEIESHPTVGRYAFLLEPEGVRLHWITNGQSYLGTGVEPDNAIDEPANRRGPKTLPLKAGEWNNIVVALKGDVITLTLNGVEIYQRALEAENDRRFGLFHFTDRSALKVRNVILTGNWPEKLTPEQLADLTQPLDPKPTASQRRAAYAAIGDEFLGQNAYDIVQQARKAAPPQRYELLRRWVLPNEDHPSYRLFGDYTPTNPAPGHELAAKSENGDKAAKRSWTGGALVAPAIELIATAKELGRLAELDKELLQAKTTNMDDERGRIALLVLTSAAAGDVPQATERMKELSAKLATIVDGTPAHRRWPELVVATALLESPPLRSLVPDFAWTIVKQTHQKSVNPQWDIRVRHVHAISQLLARTDINGFGAGSSPALAQWSAVAHDRAETRGLGEPPPTWTLEGSELKHLPGHARDFMYFNVPLIGDFEVTATLSGAPDKAVGIAYSGLAAQLSKDKKTVELTRIGHEPASRKIEPPLKEITDSFDYRLSVKGETCTAFANGQKVYEQALPKDRDPWLAVFCDAKQTGSIRNLRITGQPQAPEQLTLSSQPDLSGWIADYFHDRFNDKPAPPARSSGEQSPSLEWEKKGNEIVGNFVADARGTLQERVLRYHRPLVEDGVLEYEFWRERGKTMVHPALDRLTFLLDPSGVRIHWITDGQFERSGLTPDNVSDEPANRRGALKLKEGDWNAVKVTLKGDLVTLELNGQAIYERPLEATNQRTFGLFYYADQTGARVRNVVYRGNWAKSLPTKQELATKAD